MVLPSKVRASGPRCRLRNAESAPVCRPRCGVAASCIARGPRLSCHRGPQAAQHPPGSCAAHALRASCRCADYDSFIKFLINKCGCTTIILVNKHVRWNHEASVSASVSASARAPLPTRRSTAPSNAWPPPPGSTCASAFATAPGACSSPPSTSPAEGMARRRARERAAIATLRRRMFTWRRPKCSEARHRRRACGGRSIRADFRPPFLLPWLTSCS